MSFPADLTGRLLWLLNHSLQAGILVLLVLLVQWLFRHRLTNRWRFALWWLVLLRLVLPFSPQSAVSLFNVVHPSVHFPAVAASRAGAADQQLDAVQPAVETSTPFESDPIPELGLASAMRPEPATSGPPLRETTPTPPAIHFTLPIILTALWLMGIVVLISIVATQLSRFYRQLSAGATPANARLRALFEECRAEFQVSRRIDLLETDAVRSPALFGLLRLRLLLPRGLDAQFERPELRYIFFHELAHVKRRDLWLNWLVTALQIMHWFNPLLWFGFARLRADRELACDELALLRAGDHAGTAYGQTVIKLLENLNRPAAIPGLIGILEDRRQMRRRIAMIAGFHRPGRWSLLAGLLLAALAAVALTDAPSDQPTPKLRVDGLANRTISPNQSPYDNYFTPENNMVMPDKGSTLPPGQTTNNPLGATWDRRSETLAALRSRMSTNLSGRTVIARLKFSHDALADNYLILFRAPAIYGTNFIEYLKKYHQLKTDKERSDYSQSAEAEQYHKNSHYHEFAPQTDGSFRAEDVPPGQYIILVTEGIRTKPPTVAESMSDRILLVPPARDGHDDSPVYWSEVEITGENLLSTTGASPRPWTVSGHVLDRETKLPIQNFQVTPGQLDVYERPAWNGLRTVTGSNGVYTAFIGGHISQPLLKVAAGGYLPASVAVQPHDASNVDFELQRGSGPSGIVVTPDGRPAPEASLVLLAQAESPFAIDADGNLKTRKSRVYLPQTKADAHGKFSFAPALEMESVAASSSNGFAITSLATLATQKTITLQPYGRITGTLIGMAGPRAHVDLDLRFANLPDIRTNMGTGVAWIDSPGHVITDADGRFDFLQVPPGHLSITARHPFPQGGWQVETLGDVDLKPGQMLWIDLPMPTTNNELSGVEKMPAHSWGNVTGIVLLPDGTGPAANVDVALQIENGYPPLGKGVFASREVLRKEGLLVRTGPDGSFMLPLQDDAISVLALGERGCAQATLEQMRQHPLLMLQKWGRIEGTLHIGGRPASHELVSVTHLDLVRGTNATPEPMYSPEAIAARTDAEGHFVLSHVPPGEQILGRRGTRAEGGDFRMSTVLEVAPGATVVTNLEDDSRAVIVSLTHHGAGLSKDENSSLVVIETSALIELQKKYVPIKTDADRQAFHDDAEKIRSKIGAYVALPKRDGSFRAEGVPPGEYYIHLEEPEHPDGAFIRSEHTLVVPSETGDRVASPVNWGEVNLIDDPARGLAEKTNAPNSATKMDGAPEQATAGQPPSPSQRPEDSYQGVVLLPDGQPAANVNVALQTEDWAANVDWFLKKGKFTDRDDLRQAGVLVTTGPDGSFKLSRAAHAMSVLVLDERGCARVSLEQLRHNPQIILQKWGRIEGTLRIGDHPGSNVMVSVTPSNFSPKTNAIPRKVPPPMYSPNAIAVKTDAQGRFILTYVPPGEQIFGRRWPSGQGDGGFSDLTVLKVAPGTTVVTNIDDNSRVVTATLTYREPDLVDDSHGSLAIMESVAQVELRKRFSHLKTDADRQVYYDDAVKNRPNLRVYLIQSPRDGALHLEGVQPGEYYIELQEIGSTNTAFFRSDRTVVVPPATGDQLAIPVNCGEVHLTEKGLQTPVLQTAEADSATASATDNENALEYAMTGWPPSANSGPGETFKGVVLSPDGEPATNAEVTVPENCLGLTLGWGEFIFNGAGTGGPLETTAPDGSFTMPLLPRARTIAAVSKEGFALMSLEDFLLKPQLKLQKWGRIEGSLIINHKTCPHETVRLEPIMPPWLAAIWFPTPSHGIPFLHYLSYDSDAYRIKTDDHGKFAFDLVPPGENSVLRVISTGGDTSSLRQLENVDVKPGATVVANIGGAFRTVTGRIKITAGAVRDWQNHGIILIGACSAKPKADGTFRAEDVPVGNYDIQLLIESPGSINYISVVYKSAGTRSVPAAKDDRDDSPVDLGEVKLEESSRQPTPPITNTDSSATGSVAQPASAPERLVANQPPNSKSTHDTLVKGTILLPDGQPAANVDVALQITNGYPWFGKGVFASRDFLHQEGLLVSTGPDGNFTLPMRDDAISVLALDGRGCAQATVEQLQQTPQITLQKWGRIEGTLRVGDHPGSNQLVSVTPFPFYPDTQATHPNIREPMYAPDAIATRTDAQGRFVLTCVPPGRQVLGRHLPSGPGLYGYSQSAVLEVKPGATIATNIEDNGRIVIARVKYHDAGLTGGKTKLEVTIETTANAEFEKKFSSDGSDFDSQEYKDYMKKNGARLRSYPAILQPDGSLRATEVLPGEYYIALKGFGATNFAYYKSDQILVVPPATGDPAVVPVDWGTIHLTEYKPSFPAPLQGIVLLPNGQPATNATVALPGKSITPWRDGFALTSPGPGGALANTAPDGSFTLPTYSGARSIIALSHDGFAEMSLKQFRAAPQLKLQKWGRIEGTLIINHQIRSNELVTLGPWTSSGMTLDGDPQPLFYNPETSKTDNSGRFVFTFVPPGRHIIMHGIQTGKNSPYFNDLEWVDVAPGATTVTNAGSAGRSVTGRITFEKGLVPDWQTPGSFMRMETSSTNYLAKVRRLKSISMPPLVWPAIENSSQFSSLRPIIRQYIIKPQPDGSFHLDDVAAGQYTIDLYVNATNLPAIFYQTAGLITVPPAKDDQDDSAVDWGEIQLSKQD